MPARAADIYVPPGANLQTAIDKAQPGDRLLLAPEATYVGNFRLTDKGGSSAYITIRSAAADTLLPPDGARILPSDAFNLPKIKSPNTSASLTAAAGAHHWKLQFLEFQANDRGFGDIIALGAGDSTQTLLSQVPHDLVLDRLYVHGDPVIGQKRGISLHSGATWVLNCYISDIKGVGMDTQAIMGYNGPGPYTIANNYLEAAGENFLLGGASPKIANVIPSDIDVRGNHLFKPLAWRLPILRTPGGVTAGGGTGGSLPAATYSYRVVAARSTAGDAWAFSDRSAEVNITVAAGGRTTIAWAPVANATLYRVYRGSAPGAQDRYFKTTGTSFVDDGSAGGTADTGSSIMATRWSVKNIFELKLGQRVHVRGNLMENCWKESQAGYAVLITPRNQDATSPWIYVRDVEFRGNLVRHAAGGVQIEGHDTNAASGQTQRVTFADNIFDDISSAKWGGSGRWIQVGNAPRDITIDHNTVVHDSQMLYVYGGSYGAEMEVPNLRFTNNLAKHNAYGVMGDGRAFGTDTLDTYFPGAVVARNTFAGGPSSRYPADNEFPTVAYWQAQFVDAAASDFRLVDGSPYRASGTDALDLGAPAAQVAADAAAALAGRNDGTPLVPVVITTDALPAGQTGSPYAGALSASGGSGAYMWSITAGTLPQGVTLAPATGVLIGTPAEAGVFAVTVRAQDWTDATNAATRNYDLEIASTSLLVALTAPANGAVIVGGTMTLAAAASNADGSVASVAFYVNGTLVGSASSEPWSLSLSNLAPGTYRLAAVASGDSGLSTTSGFVDVVLTAPVSMGAGPLPAGRVGTSYSAALTAFGGTGSYTWSVVNGQLPPGLSLDSATGVISGIPLAMGVSIFAVGAQDATVLQNAASRSCSIDIAAAPRVLPGIIQAEDFDGGGEGIAYHDATAGNTGGMYRQTDVDVERTSDAGGGFNVGWMRKGEWLKYTVRVLTAGTYTVGVRVAARSAGGGFHLEFGGVDKTGRLRVPNTRGLQKWTTVRKTVRLAAGTQVMRLVLDANGSNGSFGNVNRISVIFQGTALPGTLQAENFDGGGEGIAYHDSTAGNAGGAYRATDVDIEPTTDAGGGVNVGWILPGEWLKYTVTVARTRTYSIAVRVAAEAPGGTFHLEFGGVNKTGPLTIPNTGGYQKWTTITKTVRLAAGTQTLRLSFDSSGPTGIFGNVNSIAITAAR